MEISLYNQLLTVLFSFVLGIPCGLLYDLFKVIRCALMPSYTEKFISKHINKEYKRIENPIKEKKSSSKIPLYIFIGILDVLYFIFLIPVFCIFTYIMNDGILRWYIFFFSLLGFVVYKITIGRINAVIIDYMSFYLRVLLKYLIFFVKMPINKLKEKQNEIKIKLKKKNEKANDKKETERNVLISFGK